MKILTTFLFVLATLFAAANVTGQTISQEQAQAEWEHVKRTMLIWTCSCVAGREVWGYKTLQQMEDESNARVNKEKAIMEKLSQQASVRYDPSTMQYLATALANVCK
jgi:hypothetical protein